MFVKNMLILLHYFAMLDLETANLQYELTNSRKV